MITVIFATAAALAGCIAPDFGPQAPPPTPKSLADAIESARRCSPTLESARARADEGIAAASKAWAAWQPDLTVQATGFTTTAPQSLDLQDFVRLTAGVFQIPPVQTGLVPPPTWFVRTWNATGSATLTQPLLSPQGIWGLRAARRGSQALEVSKLEAQRQVVGATAQLYLTAQSLQQLVQTAARAEALGRERVQQANSRLQQGLSTKLAVIKAESEVAKAQAMRAKWSGQQQSLELALSALVGERIVPLPAGQELELLNVSGHASSEPSARYTVVAAERAIESARAELALHRLSWLPTLALQVRGNYSTNEGFAGRRTTADAGLSLVLPLYDRGLRQASQREASAKLARAQAELRRVSAESATASLSANIAVDSAAAELAAASAQAKLAGEALHHVEKAYAAGLATALDLAEADDQYFGATAAEIQARCALAVAKAASLNETDQLAGAVSHSSS